jgi:hypothetical protein
MSTLLKKKYMMNSRKRKQMETESASSCAVAESIGCERMLLASWQGSTSPTEMPAKAVRFMDEVQVITTAICKQLNAETLQRYRNDIWYTVRSDGE